MIDIMMFLLFIMVDQLLTLVTYIDGKIKMLGQL